MTLIYSISMPTAGLLDRGQHRQASDAEIVEQQLTIRAELPQIPKGRTQNLLQKSFK